MTRFFVFCNKTKTMLILDNLSITIHKKKILQDCSATFFPGKINFIMSSSGAGKTTLFKTMAGRIRPSAGQIRVDGISPPIGYMNQELCLFESLTVLETCQFYHSMSTDEFRPDDFFIDYLTTFGLDTCLNTKVGNPIHGGISGGEKKRLVLACHLLRNLPVLLLDEPLTGLNETMCDLVFEILQKHVEENQNICLVSVHNPTPHMESLMENVWVLENGELVRHPRKNLPSTPEFVDIVLDTSRSSSLDSEITLGEPRKGNFCKLLRRELLMTRHHPGEFIGRFVIITLVALLESFIIGFHSKFVENALTSTNLIDQINFFMHLIIIYFTSSTFPVLFVTPFFQYLQTIHNEVHQGWYPYKDIYHVKIILELFQIILMSFLYSFLVWMPPLFYKPGPFWIFTANILFQMTLSMIFMFILSLTKSYPITLGSLILYNTFSFLFNIGYIIQFKNRFSSILQYFSIIYIQTNANILSIQHENPTFTWLIEQINIKPSIFYDVYQPMLFSTGFVMGALALFYGLTLFL